MTIQAASPSERVVFAHLLRGIACVAVLVSHFFINFWSLPKAVAELLKIPELAVTMPNYLAPLHAYPSFNFGSFGVALFFLISGFVIPFSLRHFSVRGFFVARLFRILPTYWLSLSVALFSILSLRLAFEPDGAFPYGFREIALQSLLLRGWAWIPSIDGISWTLEIEAVFYVLMGALSFRLAEGKKALHAILLYGVGTLLFCLVATTLLDHSIKFFKKPILFLNFSLPFTAYMLIGTVLHLCLLKKVDRASGFLAGTFLVGVFLAGVKSCPSLASLDPIPYLLALGFFVALVVFGLAWLLHRFMEVPSMKFGKKLAKRLVSKSTA